MSEKFVCSDCGSPTDYGYYKGEFLVSPCEVCKKAAEVLLTAKLETLRQQLTIHTDSLLHTILQITKDKNSLLPESKNPV